MYLYVFCSVSCASYFALRRRAKVSLQSHIVHVVYVAVLLLLFIAAANVYVIIIVYIYPIDTLKFCYQSVRVSVYIMTCVSRVLRRCAPPRAVGVRLRHSLHFHFRRSVLSVHIRLCIFVRTCLSVCLCLSCCTYALRVPLRAQVQCITCNSCLFRRSDVHLSCSFSSQIEGVCSDHCFVGRIPAR